jgi:NAD(P)-dependent dehydrogenase (short-subunit alcohol dehydrogenase family)
MHIKDRTFIITGGASGLGLATTEDLHSHGGYVAILDLNPDNGAKVAKRLGERVKFFEVDVTNSERQQEVIKQVVQWTKETGKEIGGVIPAAGVGLPGKLIDRHGTPIEMSKLDFVIDINLRAVLDFLRLCVPHMVAVKPLDGDGERGVIVMVSSSAAFDGQPGQLSYAATKGAIRSMTLVLARDLAVHGIRAVSIAPAMFDTAMTANMSDKVRSSLVRMMEFPKRPGQAPEFALTVRQCIENTYLNGECIRLDGGTRMPSKM